MTETVTPFGPDLGGQADKWCGGALGADGAVYGVPLCASRVLRVDTHDNTVEMIGDEWPGNHKWGYAVASAGGACILCTPRLAAQVLCIDVDAKTTRLVGPDLNALTAVSHDKWRGAVLGCDGNMYATPMNCREVSAP